MSEKGIGGMPKKFSNLNQGWNYSLVSWIQDGQTPSSFWKIIHMGL